MNRHLETDFGRMFLLNYRAMGLTPADILLGLIDRFKLNSSLTEVWGEFILNFLSSIGQFLIIVDHFSFALFSIIRFKTLI
jgi:hypothetical protein